MNRNNDIRSDFRVKLGGYPSPLPPDGWERIEQSMRQVAARRVMRRRWVAGAAAAMLILLVGSLFFLHDPMTHEQPMLTEEVNSPMKSQSHSLQTAEQATANRLPQSVTHPAVATPALYVTLNHGFDEKYLIQGNRSAEIMQQWIRQNGVAPERLVNRDRSVMDRLGSLAERSWKSISNHDDDELITVDDRDEELFAYRSMVRAEDEHMTLMLGGKGGLSSFRQTVNAPMTLRSASLSAQDQYGTESSKNLLTTTRAVDNLSEMEHDQPVSLGLTLSKSIFDNLSIESGLTYTYLSSRVRNANANFRVQETQKIHYLGIPVNLNYTLFSLRRLDVYASVGGLIEKDIYGEYRKMGTGETLDFNSSAEEEEVTTILQRNPQLSVNAGLGLSYPLIQNLKLYGKVGGAYYFDAGNEYKTIYSDRKIVMDLNVGIRYEF